MLERHVEYTGSAVAARILASWSESAPVFVKVMPRDYKRALDAEARAASVTRLTIHDVIEANGVAAHG